MAESVHPPLAFQQQQYAFTAHLRRPDGFAAPSDIEDRRMQVYRELLFNNIKSFIDCGFPVLHSLYADADWQQLVRNFFATHHSQSPYFVDIAREFLDYLEHEHQPLPNDPPFLYALAHYEWVELVLMTAPDTPAPDHVERHGSLLEQRPVLSELAQCYSYAWPVHQIAPEAQPSEALEQPVFILVYRAFDGEVKFIELNPVSALLFEQLQHNTQHSGQQLLASIAEHLQHPDPDLVVQGGLQTLTRWHHLGIVLGVEPLVDADLR